MAAIIGALRVTLGADTASFEDGLKKAGSGLKDFARNVATIAAGVGLEKIFEKVGESIGGMIKATFNAIEGMDKMGKEAQKLGIGVEKISELSVAATLSGLSIQELSTAIVKLSKNMVEGTDKATEPAARAFKSLNISVKESSGQFKSSDALLAEVADRFEKMEDGVVKTTLATMLFGKAGAALIPLLNEGSKGFKIAAEQAEALNLKIGPEAAKSSQVFNDQMKLVNASLTTGFANVIAEKLLPGLEKFSKALLDITIKTNGFKVVAEGVAMAITNFIELFKDIGAIVQFIVDNISALVGWLVKLGAAFLPEPVLTFFKKLAEAVTENKTGFDLLGGDLKGRTFFILEALGLKTDALRERFHKLTGAVKPFIEISKSPPPAIITAEQVQEAKRLQDAIDGAALKTKTFALELQGLAPGFVSAVSGMGELGKSAILTFEQTGKLPPKFAELNAELLKLKGTTLLFENLDPIIRLNMELEKTRLAFKAIAITEGPELERALDRVREKFGETWGAIGKNLADFAGSMSTLTKTLGKENKEMIILSKVFGIAQAIINTQIAVTKALAELGPIAGPIAAAAAVAAGAAAVATIAAQGFAKGGSFVVPGGTSGVDNVRMPIDLASGELVTVETPEQQKRGRGQTVINLRGKSFGFDDIRDVFDQINAGMRDGHRFLVARA